MFAKLAFAPQERLLHHTVHVSMITSFLAYSFYIASKSDLIAGACNFIRYYRKSVAVSTKCEKCCLERRE